MMARIQPTNDNAMIEPNYDAKAVSEVNSSHKMIPTGVHEHKNHGKRKIVVNTSNDDQIDSNIIFNDPYVENNSGSTEHDSWVPISQTTKENGITTLKMSTPVTAKEKTKKKNDVKARATKKTQKTLLKQQYENFSATSAESLNFIFNRIQKIVSRLAILGVIIA
ncbi:hypothetical protein Tco_0224802 [Tanacetum coccineum]